MSRILTTHVGSLVRPPELVEFLRAQEAGEQLDAAAFDDCLRRSVARVVADQAAAGVDLVCDGEFGKTVSWSRYVRQRLAGFTERPSGDVGATVLPGTDKRLFGDFYAEYEKTQGFTGSLSGWVCTGPVSYIGQQTLARDIDNLKAAVAEVDVRGAFLPVVAPASVVPIRADEHYPDEESYVYAVADALAVEYRTIVDAGLGLQIDDAWLASMYDTMIPEQPVEEYRRWAQLRIDALNHALDGIAPERVRYHVCHGSWNAPHVGDAPLTELIDLILQVRAGGYAIELANPRHEHEWRVFEQIPLPDDKILLPGLISHVTNVVEHPELVADRIERLARLLGPERVVASTDCGFAQGPFVRRVHPSIQWAKLEALAAGARLAERRLSGRATGS